MNIAGGYDTAEPGDGWGWADRGSRTQLSFEMVYKDASNLLRDYTPLIQPAEWNLKFAWELDPRENDAQQAVGRLRPNDTFINFSTKWDRTAIRVGHFSLPYGHNPRLDASQGFLPNQSGIDLSFGRDTGAMLRTPLTTNIDLELSATLGKGDTWDYHVDGWL